jgi:signal transduction histidine kinase
MAALARAEAAATVRGVELSLKVAEEVPATAVGDAARLTHMLHHLLDNAVRAVQPGCGVVALSVRLIHDGNADPDPGQAALAGQNRDRVAEGESNVGGGVCGPGELDRDTELHAATRTGTAAPMSPDYRPRGAPDVGAGVGGDAALIARPLHSGRAAAPSMWIQWCVLDNGPGTPAAARNTVLMTYEQALAAVQHHSGTAGTGLLLVHEYARRMAAAHGEPSCVEMLVTEAMESEGGPVPSRCVCSSGCVGMNVGVDAASPTHSVSAAGGSSDSHSGGVALGSSFWFRTPLVQEQRSQRSATASSAAGTPHPVPLSRIAGTAGGGNDGSRTIGGGDAGTIGFGGAEGQAGTSVAVTSNPIDSRHGRRAAAARASVGVPCTACDSELVAQCVHTSVSSVLPPPSPWWSRWRSNVMDPDTAGEGNLPVGYASANAGAAVHRFSSATVAASAAGTQTRTANPKTASSATIIGMAASTLPHPGDGWCPDAHGARWSASGAGAAAHGVLVPAGAYVPSPSVPGNAGSGHLRTTPGAEGHVTVQVAAPSAPSPHATLSATPLALGRTPAATRPREQWSAAAQLLLAPASSDTQVGTPAASVPSTAGALARMSAFPQDAPRQPFPRDDAPAQQEASVGRTARTTATDDGVAGGAVATARDDASARGHARARPIVWLHADAETATGSDHSGQSVGACGVAAPTPAGAVLSHQSRVRQPEGRVHRIIDQAGLPTGSDGSRSPASPAALTEEAPAFHTLISPSADSRAGTGTGSQASPQRLGGRPPSSAAGRGPTGPGSLRANGNVPHHRLTTSWDTTPPTVRSVVADVTCTPRLHRQHTGATGSSAPNMPGTPDRASPDMLDAPRAASAAIDHGFGVGPLTSAAFELGAPAPNVRSPTATGPASDVSHRRPDAYAWLSGANAAMLPPTGSLPTTEQVLVAATQLQEPQPQPQLQAQPHSLAHSCHGESYAAARTPHSRFAPQSAGICTDSTPRMLRGASSIAVQFDGGDGASTGAAGTSLIEAPATPATVRLAAPEVPSGERYRVEWSLKRSRRGGAGTALVAASSTGVGPARSVADPGNSASTPVTPGVDATPGVLTRVAYRVTAAAAPAPAPYSVHDTPEASAYVEPAPIPAGPDARVGASMGSSRAGSDPAVTADGSPPPQLVQPLEHAATTASRAGLIRPAGAGANGANVASAGPGVSSSATGAANAPTSHLSRALLAPVKEAMESDAGTPSAPTPGAGQPSSGSEDFSSGNRASARAAIPQSDLDRAAHARSRRHRHSLLLHTRAVSSHVHDGQTNGSIALSPDTMPATAAASALTSADAQPTELRIKVPLVVSEEERASESEDMAAESAEIAAEGGGGAAAAATVISSDTNWTAAAAVPRAVTSAAGERAQVEPSKHAADVLSEAITEVLQPPAPVAQAPASAAHHQTLELRSPMQTAPVFPSPPNVPRLVGVAGLQGRDGVEHCDTACPAATSHPQRTDGQPQRARPGECSSCAPLANGQASARSAATAPGPRQSSASGSSAISQGAFNVAAQLRVSGQADKAVPAGAYPSPLHILVADGASQAACVHNECTVQL